MENDDQIWHGPIENELALIKELTKPAVETFVDNTIGALAGYNRIENAPAVDVAPVVHGRWIDDRTNIMCSVCGARYKDEIVFMPYVYVSGKRYDGLEHCPHCGAKMDEDD